MYINHVQHINQPLYSVIDSNCMKTWKKTIIHEYKEIKPALHNGNKADGSGSYGKLISRFSALLAYYHFNPTSEWLIAKWYVPKQQLLFISFMMALNLIIYGYILSNFISSYSFYKNEYFNLTFFQAKSFWKVNRVWYHMYYTTYMYTK